MCGECTWTLKAIAGIAPPTAGGIAFAAASRTAPRHAPREFFVAGAEVVAVLFLAAALEARLFSLRRMGAPPQTFGLRLRRVLELIARFSAFYNAIRTSGDGTARLSAGRRAVISMTPPSGLLPHRW